MLGDRASEKERLERQQVDLGEKERNQLTTNHRPRSRSSALSRSSLQQRPPIQSLLPALINNNCLNLCQHQDWQNSRQGYLGRRRIAGDLGYDCRGQSEGCVWHWCCSSWPWVLNRDRVIFGASCNGREDCGGDRSTISREGRVHLGDLDRDY